jgi:hypothetical protein
MKLLLLTILGIMVSSQARAYNINPDNCSPFAYIAEPYKYDCKGQWVKICTTHPNGYSRTWDWVCMR